MQIKQLFMAMTLLVSGFLSNHVQASSMTQGRVSLIYPSVAGSTIYFRLAGDCKGGVKYWSFDLEGRGGKAIYTLLLAAANSGKPVKIYSDAGCNPNTNQEISYVVQSF